MHGICLLEERRAQRLPLAGRIVRISTAKIADVRSPLSGISTCSVGRLGRVDYVAALQFEEKAIVLREKHVLNQLVILDHLQQVHNIQVPRQHFLPFFQLEVLNGVFVIVELLAVLQFGVGSAGTTAQEIGQCLALGVYEATLVEDEMVNEVELLASWRPIDQIFALVSEAFHEVCLLDGHLLRVLQNRVPAIHAPCVHA